MLPGHSGRVAGLFRRHFERFALGPSGFQAESSHAFAAFVEDQPVEVIGHVAEGGLCFGTGQADGADEQPEPVFLMRENMFDMGPDRRLAALALAIALGMGLPLGLRR